MSVTAIKRPPYSQLFSVSVSMPDDMVEVVGVMSIRRSLSEKIESLKKSRSLRKIETFPIDFYLDYSIGEYVFFQSFRAEVWK